MSTKSEIIATDIVGLFRARTPVIWITTREEARVERYLIEAAAAAGYLPRTWDIAAGVNDMQGEAIPAMNGVNDPSDAFDLILNRAKRQGTSNGQPFDRGVWIMRDLPVWLGGPSGAVALRKLRNLTRKLPSMPREGAQAIVVMSPTGDVPPELSGQAAVMEWPLPDRDEVRAILQSTIDSLPEFETDPQTKQPDPARPLRALAAPNGQFEAAIDAAIGLTEDEIRACYAKSIVQLRRIDPAAVAQEKKRVIAREKVLEWFDPLPGGLDSVGGLEVLKGWLIERKMAYTPAARAYGLPMPKGALLVGIPGCGKSLIAKAMATAYGVPLLRVDLGALKSKFIGESESNLRKAFTVIAAIGRCVVWFDEIEKALAGATQGAADGGVSSDALGSILSWMQDRQGEAFVIATANDITGLPPELLRKGRFDDVWFVDLPTAAERAEVLRAALVANGRNPTTVDREEVAVRHTNNFTGAEMAAIVPDAMFKAFADGGRELTTADLIVAAKTVKPLADTAKDKIDNLRKFVEEGRARRASYTEEKTVQSGGVALDI